MKRVTAAKELAIEGLALGLAAALQPAGADGDVRALLDGGKEVFSLLNGRREVGVGEQHHIAPRLEHPGAHAVAFAAVAGVFKQPDLGRILRKGAHHVGGRVGGAVVDYQNLGIPATCSNAAHHRGKRRQDAGALVVNRNHDAVLWPGAFAGVALGIVFHVSAPSPKPNSALNWGRESTRNVTGHHKRLGAKLAGESSDTRHFR